MQKRLAERDEEVSAGMQRESEAYRTVAHQHAEIAQLRKERNANKACAEIGEAYMKAIAEHNPHACWNECPTEVYTDALNEMYDKDSELKQLTADNQRLREDGQMLLQEIQNTPGWDMTSEAICNFEQALAQTGESKRCANCEHYHTSGQLCYNYSAPMEPYDTCNQWKKKHAQTAKLGLPIVADDSIPSGEIHFVSDGKMVGKIINADKPAQGGKGE